VQYWDIKSDSNHNSCWDDCGSHGQLDIDVHFLCKVEWTQCDHCSFHMGIDQWARLTQKRLIAHAAHVDDNDEGDDRIDDDDDDDDDGTDESFGDGADDNHSRK
jgi:hypothetical protein